MVNLIRAMLDRPGVPEPYREWRDYFKSLGMTKEAEAFAELVEKRSNNANRTHSSG